MPIQVQQVGTPKQCAEVAALAQTIWREYYTPIIGAKQVEYMLTTFQSQQAVMQAVTERSLDYYLVIKGGMASGYFAVKNDPTQKTLFLSKLYVQDTRRGLGLGRFAMSRIEKIARDAGCESIWLTVNKTNQNSIGIYKKFGFEIAEELVTDIGEGFVMDDYKMVKRLS